MGAHDDPRQRLPPAPAARRRARARDGRPAPVHGVGRSDPHRLRRLPGLLARDAAHGRARTASSSAATSTARARCFTPESVMQIERNLGADVIMQFDHVDSRAERRADRARDASERSLRWLARCLDGRSTRLRRGQRRASRRRSFPSCRAASTPHLRREAARAISRHGRLGRLRHRRTVGRRGKARHVRDARGRRRRAARATGRATSWASASRRTSSKGSRAASTCSTAWRPRAWGGTAPPSRRDGRINIKRAEFRHDPTAARRDVRLRGLHALLTCLHPASVRGGRDARAPPALPAQCTFPRSH